MSRKREWAVITFCLVAFMMSALIGVFVADNTQPLTPQPTTTINVYKVKVQVQKVADAATAVAKSMDK